jgi:hypothetical protein
MYLAVKEKSVQIDPSCSEKMDRGGIRYKP